LVQRGRTARSVRRAHNPEVGGSKEQQLFGKSTPRYLFSVVVRKAVFICLNDGESAEVYIEALEYADSVYDCINVVVVGDKSEEFADNGPVVVKECLDDVFDMVEALFEFVSFAGEKGWFVHFCACDGKFVACEAEEGDAQFDHGD